MNVVLVREKSLVEKMFFDPRGLKRILARKKYFGAKIFLFDFFTFYAISKRFFVKSDITKSRFLSLRNRVKREKIK